MSGAAVDFVDQQVDNRDIGALASSTRPSLALIGGTTHSRFASFRIADVIKSHSPRTLTVYGGPHATIADGDTLTHIPSVDVVVRG